MKWIFSIQILFYCIGVTAQDIPSFKMLRYDEDYAFLNQDSIPTWYRKMKYSRISNGGNTFISCGGDVRFQYFYLKNENWGDDPVDNDGFILTRWLAHADLHSGQHFRTFVQLQSSLANSRIDPSTQDENPLELNQAFVDVSANISPVSTLTFRLGRQEYLFGSQRLLSVNDGPNHRRSFDAVTAIIQFRHYKIDLFYSHPVALKAGIFNDGYNRDSKLWGAYIVRNNLPVLRNIDLYYLGLWKRNSTFDEGEGRELRHSIGTRIWKNTGNWHYDIEALYQFGKFSDEKISAWTGSVKTFYHLDHIKLKPDLGLKTELISGNKYYEDKKLQTFNPLFPRDNYFGLAAIIGPVNLLDIHPSLSLKLSTRLGFDLDYDIFWRYSQNDGLYSANVTLYYSGRNIDEKHIGNQLATALNYGLNNFINFTSEFAWFKAGEFLERAGTGKDILYTCETVQLTF